MTKEMNNIFWNRLQGAMRACGPDLDGKLIADWLTACREYFHERKWANASNIEKGHVEEMVRCEPMFEMESQVEGITVTLYIHCKEGAP